MTEEQVLASVGTSWKNDVKRIPLAKTDKAWNRERSVKSYLRFLKRFAPELLEKKPMKILDVSTRSGIFLEVLRSLGHDATGTEEPNTIFRGMHQSQGLKIFYCPTKEIEKKTFQYVFSLDQMNLLPTAIWESTLNEFTRIAKKTVIVGFVYDGYFQTHGWEIRDWKLDFDLTKVDTNVFRWDKN